jgi:O-antigen ligase
MARPDFNGGRRRPLGWGRTLSLKLMALLETRPEWLRQSRVVTCCGRLLIWWALWWGKIRVKNGWRRLPPDSWQVRSIEGIVLLYLLLQPVRQDGPFLLYGLVCLLYWYRAANSAGRPGWELPVAGIILAWGAFCAGGGRQTVGPLAEYEAALLSAWLMGRSFTPRFSRRILHWLILCSLLWMAIGLEQQWRGAPTPPGWLSAKQTVRIAVRSSAVFGNPNIYALYLVSIIGLIFGFTGPGLSKRSRLLYRIIIIIALVSLYFTYSRWGWLLALLLLGWRFRRGKPAKSRLLFMAIILLLFTLGGFQARLFGVVTGQDSSVAYRLRIWKGVGRILQSHWLWGVGPGNFHQVYLQAQVGNTFSWHAHSFYLQFWVEFGLVNLLLMLVWGENKIVKVWRDVHADPYRRAIFLGICCLAGSGLVESWQVSRFCRDYCSMLVGMFLALQHKEQ